MLHRGEVDVARRLAAGAADLQPGEAAIDGLVDGRRRVDRFAVARHPLVPLSQSSLSACRIIAYALARISADCAARILAIARALPSSFSRALRSPPDRGVGWCFGAIRTSNQTRGPGGAGDYSNEGQQPSFSWRPVRCWQVLSNRRCATSLKIAFVP